MNDRDTSQTDAIDVVVYLVPGFAAILAAAPDFFAAGSTRRVEEWHGTAGYAYAVPTTVTRS